MGSQHRLKPHWHTPTCHPLVHRRICTGDGYVRKMGLHPGASAMSLSPLSELHPTPRLTQLIGTAVCTRMVGSSTMLGAGYCRTTRCTHSTRRSPHFPRHHGRKATVDGHPMGLAPGVRTGIPVSGGLTMLPPPEAASPAQQPRHTEVLPDTVALPGVGVRPGLLGM